MDPSFVPSEIIIKHIVSHKFTLEIGPSITGLAKPVGKLILCAVVIYCLGDIVRGSLQAVLTSRGNTKDET